LFGVLGEYRIARFGRFYKEVGGFTWRVSDCEELVGVNHGRRWLGISGSREMH